MYEIFSAGITFNRERDRQTDKQRDDAYDDDDDV